MLAATTRCCLDTLFYLVFVLVELRVLVIPALLLWEQSQVLYGVRQLNSGRPIVDALHLLRLSLMLSLHEVGKDYFPSMIPLFLVVVEKI